MVAKHGGKQLDRDALTLKRGWAYHFLTRSNSLMWQTHRCKVTILQAIARHSWSRALVVLGLCFLLFNVGAPLPANGSVSVSLQPQTRTQTFKKDIDGPWNAEMLQLFNLHCSRNRQ